MAKPKILKAPADIDPSVATKPQLVTKLQEFARYTRAKQAELQATKLHITELEAQIAVQQAFSLQQQTEICFQDRIKSDEYTALEARIESAVTTLTALIKGS